MLILLFLSKQIVMTKKKVRGATMEDKLNATAGITLPGQELQPESVPRVFSRFGQRHPPTRPHPMSRSDSSQLQSLNTSSASDSLEGEPPISRGQTQKREEEVQLNVQIQNQELNMFYNSMKRCNQLDRIEMNL